MKCQEINIATARIKELTKMRYYSNHRYFYTWSITFSHPSTLIFNNLPFIKVGDTEVEGEIFFKEAHIYEGNKVAVIFGNDGNIIAIGNFGEDLWIDATDKLVKKTFKELNIVVTSLKVY